MSAKTARTALCACVAQANSGNQRNNRLAIASPSVISFALSITISHVLMSQRFLGETSLGTLTV